MSILQVETTPLYKGFLKINQANLYDDEIAQEATARYEYMERGDSVSIVCETPSGNFVVCKQFRVGPMIRERKEWSYSNPAGMIDAGETAIQAAAREVYEEVGVEPLSLKNLGTYYVSPGGTTERTTFFHAKLPSPPNGTKYVPLDTSEGIELEIRSRKDVHGGFLKKVDSLQMIFGFQMVLNQ